MDTQQIDQQTIKAALANVHIVVVIPAYRVADQIGRVISNIPSFVRHVIVVDDCCPDGTTQKVRAYLSERVRLVRHTTNQGVGGAMLTGYALALGLGADIIVKMDGDDQMSAADLPMLLLPILRGEADYTKGNRFIHSYALRSMPLGRRIGNFGLTFLTKMATGYWNIFDPNNGYTAIHSKVLRLINTDMIDRRYFFETSTLLELRRLQAVVMDVPMPARYGDEVSSLVLRRIFFDFPGKLLKGWLRRLGWQYFLFNFTAVSLLLVLGLPLLLFGFVWGALKWYISYSQGIIATTGTVLLAVLPIVLGIEFLVQAFVMDIGAVPQRVLNPYIFDPEPFISHTAPLSTYLEQQQMLVTFEATAREQD